MKRILITDDDRFMANVCRQKFEEAGFQVAVAHDGHEAIEELVLHPPDVILLDLALPEIDGLGVLRFVRSRERLGKLPVIVVSNSAYFSGVVQAAWHAGATHFFNKGDCSPKSLVDEVQKVLASAAESPVEAAPAEAATAPAPSRPPSLPAPAAPLRVEPPPLPEKRVPVKRAAGPLRVMIADDDRLIHGVLSYFLKEAGFLVTSVYDGREALDTAEVQAPDLLVLDGMMPELDGFETLKRWRQTPKLARIPVIMLTAESDRVKRADALGGGAVAYLMKPFSPDDLVDQATRFTARLA